MQEIVRVNQQNIGTEAVQTVNARELYEFLGSKRQFGDWIKERIELYGFVQDADFIQFHKKVNGSIKPLTEYHLTLDMAKEVCMVERNEKGKQARLYFIECERRVKSQTAIETPEMQMARGLLAAAAMIEEKNTLIAHRDKMIADLSPKAAIADQLVTADGLLNLTQAAKVMNVPPRKFNKQLHAIGWIYRSAGKGDWIGYSLPTKAGYLDHKIHTYKHTDGTPGTAAQVFITPKGMAKLATITSVGQAA